MEEMFGGKKVVFVVCSDEPRTVEEFEGLDVTVHDGDPMYALFTLAACDYLVGPLSIFVQWASFYGRVPLRFMRAASDEPVWGDFKVSCLDEIPQGLALRGPGCSRHLEVSQVFWLCQQVGELHVTLLLDPFLEWRAMPPKTGTSTVLRTRRPTHDDPQGRPREKTPCRS